MGRPQRAAAGGYVCDVLNRANARLTIFKKDADYEALENVPAEAVERTQTRLLAVNPKRAPHRDDSIKRLGDKITKFNASRQRGTAQVIAEKNSLYHLSCGLQIISPLRTASGGR